MLMADIGGFVKIPAKVEPLAWSMHAERASTSKCISSTLYPLKHRSSNAYIRDYGRAREYQAKETRPRAFLCAATASNIENITKSEDYTKKCEISFDAQTAGIRRSRADGQ